MKRNLAAACALALALALTACSSSTPGSSQTPPAPTGSGAGSTLPGSSWDSSIVQPPAGSQGTSSAQPPAAGSLEPSGSQPGETGSATLFIGTDGRFQEYPLEIDGDVTPAALVEGISQLTGWDLSLADEITSGKGGMTVRFAETSALFSGPPDPQKDEFHVFDALQLDQTILDSIRETLQHWAVVPGLGDPGSVDIYFCGPDGGDLVLENVGVTIPCTQPYTGFPTQSADS